MPREAGRCILCFFWPPFGRESYLWQTKETYGRVKIPFGPIKQIISHWFQLPGAALEWPPITRQGKRYKTAKTMSTHWHHCSLTTWLFIPHYAVAAAKAWTNSFRWCIEIFQKIMKIKCNLTFDRDFRSPKLVQFPRLISCAWCLHCRAKCKKGRFNWQTWSKWAACEAVRKIIQLNASLHTNWGKNELLEKGGRRAGSLWQKYICWVD